MTSKYDPKFAIELAKKKIFCDDCKKFTNSITCVFSDDPDCDETFSPEELTDAIITKADASRCSNCDSLNRDSVICGLYHQKKNPEIFKKEWGNAKKIERYLKN